MSGVVPPRLGDLPPPPPPPEPGKVPGKLPQLPPLPPEFGTPTPESPTLDERVSVLKENDTEAEPKSLERTSSNEVAQKVKVKLKDRLGGIFGFKSKAKKTPKAEKLFAEHQGAPKAEKKTLDGNQAAFDALNECFRDYSEVKNFLTNNPGAKNLTSRDLLGTYFIEKRQETHVTTVLQKPVPPALQPSVKNPLFANALKDAAKNKGSDLKMGEILEVWKKSMTDPTDGKLSTDVKLLLEFAKENYPVDSKALERKLEKLNGDQIQIQKVLTDADQNLHQAVDDLKQKKVEFEEASGELKAKEETFNESTEKYNQGLIDRAPYERAKESYSEAMERIDSLQLDLEAAERKVLTATAVFEEIETKFFELAEQKVKWKSEFDKSGAEQIEKMEEQLANIQAKISQLTLPN